MPIYSNLYSNLARQGFTKTFTHGYAQSVVAATHPQTYANNSRPPFSLQRRASKVGNFPTYHFQNAFHTSASSSSNALEIQERPEKIDGGLGLDAYYDAWQKQHPEDGSGKDKEWTQFQFAKRIEWKPSAIFNEADVKAEHSTETATTAPERSCSTSEVDDLQKVQLHDAEFAKFQAAEEAALAKIDAAIEKEIKSRQDQEIFDAELSVVAARVPTPPIAGRQSPALSSELSFERKSPSSVATSVLTDAEIQSQSYADHLTKLAESGQYEKIPTLFDGMRIAGIKPTAAAYNALLDARMHMPADRVQVGLTVGEIYLHMIQNKVLPNTATYNTMISCLASHSLEVAALRKSLEEKRTRFGGMEEAGKFMFASNEFDSQILAEADRLDLAMRMFDGSLAVRTDRTYPPETYHQLIAACSEAGRVPDMVRVYEHMEKNNIVPLASTFAPLISGFTATGDLSSAVECYNEYKHLAVAHDNGSLVLNERKDGSIYGSVVKAYIISDKIDGAMHFYRKLMDAYGSHAEFIRDPVIYEGFVEGYLARGSLTEALGWAEGIETSIKATAMSKITTIAADKGDKSIAVNAFAYVPSNFATPAMAMLALSVRGGDVASAQRYWQILSSPEMDVSTSFIEPTAMYAVAMIGSGQVVEGLTQSEQMFARIRASVGEAAALEIEEGVEFIQHFMTARGVIDPRLSTPEEIAYQHSFTSSPYPVVSYEDTFDPYAASTDFKGSTLIADELERGTTGRVKASRLNEALGRFKNMRRAGRHPRYITYAKLISAAAREERTSLVDEILAMARSDIPLLPQYSVVRYGWVSILDAMVGACLTLGNRGKAAQYHQELNDMGAAPTANTFGLYITSLKESTKTFDEASEAVKIFHRAKSEGVEPSSFLYNALIGKLGKARRIDDCLFYFAEMRALGIRPTSVTYGTIVNALCRVSDEKFAEELFEEMESMPNYKARPAPYNSLMQFFLTTKRDKSKVLSYYERMKSKGIQPTNHTYKLLVDTHATLEPINMAAAEAILDLIRSTGQRPEAVHYSSLIHAKGCVMHDMEGARTVFNSVIADPSIRPQACLYQALFESMVANHRVADTESVLREMSSHRVEMTPYIANTLIHGWTAEKNIDKCKSIFASVGREKREPSTYEAMTRAYLAVEDRASAKNVVQEMLSRGYPSAVSNKILELLGGGNPEATL